MVVSAQGVGGRCSAWGALTRRVTSYTLSVRCGLRLVNLPRKHVTPARKDRGALDPFSCLWQHHLVCRRTLDVTTEPASVPNPAADVWRPGHLARNPRLAVMMGCRRVPSYEESVGRPARRVLEPIPLRGPHDAWQGTHAREA